MLIYYIFLKRKGFMGTNTYLRIKQNMLKKRFPRYFKMFKVFFPDIIFPSHCFKRTYFPSCIYGEREGEIDSKAL